MKRSSALVTSTAWPMRFASAERLPLIYKTPRPRRPPTVSSRRCPSGSVTAGTARSRSTTSATRPCGPATGRPRSSFARAAARFGPGCDRWGSALALGNVAMARLKMGDVDDAAVILERALRESFAVGATMVVAMCLTPPSLSQRLDGHTPKLRSSSEQRTGCARSSACHRRTSSSCGSPKASWSVGRLSATKRLQQGLHAVRRGRSRRPQAPSCGRLRGHPREAHAVRGCSADRLLLRWWVRTRSRSEAPRTVCRQQPDCGERSAGRRRVAVAGRDRLSHRRAWRREPGGSLDLHRCAGRTRRREVDYVVLQQGPSTLPESASNLREWTVRWADAIRERGARPAPCTKSGRTRRSVSGLSFPAVVRSYRAPPTRRARCSFPRAKRGGRRGVGFRGLPCTGRTDSTRRS